MSTASVVGRIETHNLSVANHEHNINLLPALTFPSDIGQLQIHNSLPMCDSTATMMLSSMKLQIVKQWASKIQGMNVVPKPTMMSSQGCRYCVTQLNGLWYSWCMACSHRYRNRTYRLETKYMVNEIGSDKHQIVARYIKLYIVYSRFYQLFCLAQSHIGHGFGLVHTFGWIRTSWSRPGSRNIIVKERDTWPWSNVNRANTGRHAN